MAIVQFCNVRGEPQGDAIPLDRRRRRLSTVVAKHTTNRRPFLVSVHRRGADVVVTDATVRMRKQWKDTLIGADDVVLVTYLPMGGGAGGQKVGKQIGMAVAMIALAIAMPYAIGAIGAGVAGMGSLVTAAGALSVTGKLVAAGLTAGIAVGPSCTFQRSAR